MDPTTIHPTPLIGKWIRYRWEMEEPRRGWFVGKVHSVHGVGDGDANYRISYRRRITGKWAISGAIPTTLECAQHGSTAARQHGSTTARQHGSTAAAGYWFWLIKPPVPYLGTRNSFYLLFCVWCALYRRFGLQLQAR
jgi:hypothetical protein